MTGTAGSLSYRLMASWVVIPSAGVSRVTHLVSHDKGDTGKANPLYCSSETHLQHGHILLSPEIVWFIEDWRYRVVP
jgi:hypothetical protein